MRTYQQDAAKFAAEANRYNFDQVIEYLIEYYEPKVVAQHLKQVYFTLSNYILRDTDYVGGREDIVDNMDCLRYLCDAIETMTNGDQQEFIIIPAVAKLE